ncbi:AzlC family ABC transporter permease [Arenicella xantha]|uniref:4-azaleucine resistance transporter AzlC n=1 Tax=Arenicella xantha TaxID=644221 RepID=A0A395JF84_9GAMM|nr:AzlC family ABC transporter permease [Arenicella xantha]RBP48344.1 4-azaleucine resistance transporter AzlC [Arenicella xantha]
MTPRVPTKARVWPRAIADTLPLAIAVIPWGILTGALGLQVGLSALQAQLMSLLVFAGAAQLSAMTLMAGGSSLAAIYASTFVISSRHLLYSVVFRAHVAHLSLAWRLGIGFVLTDEMFAVSQNHTNRTGAFSPTFALVSGVTFYVVWNLATLLGIVAGSALTDLDSLGLDFAIAATFIAMTFDQLRRFPIAVTVIVSGVSAVLLKPLFSDSYLVMAALLGMFAGFVTETLRENV